MRRTRLFGVGAGRVAVGDGGNAVVAALLGSFLAGVVIGAGLLLAGSLDLVGEPAQTAAAVSTSYRHCPGGDVLGTVNRGDRVYITARDTSGAWLQVRSPVDSGDRVWLRAVDVLPDGALTDFPVLRCDAPVKAIVVTTATDAPDTTATTEAPDTTATTEAPEPTTATVPPDTTPPSISNAAVVPGRIWEQDGGIFSITCPAGNPRSAVISVTVTDGGGVATVTARWSDPLGTQSRTMSASGNTFSASLGPYAADTWDPDHLSPFDHLVAITITARDVAGNQSSVTANGIVMEAGECFG